MEVTGVQEESKDSSAVGCCNPDITYYKRGGHKGESLRQEKWEPHVRDHPVNREEALKSANHV